MADWSTWASPIIAAAVGAGAGGAIANWSADRSSRRDQGEVRRRALIALFNELKFAWASKDTHVWHAHAGLPTDAFEAAKAHLADIPQSLCDDVYKAEQAISRYNAIALYSNDKVSMGGGFADSHVSDALREVQGYAGTAWGHLERYLKIGAHGEEDRARRSTRWRRAPGKSL
jgi:hypothetical protein